MDNQTSTVNSSSNICEGFPYLTEEVQRHINDESFTVCNKVFIALNVVLSVITSCTNALVVRSIWKTPSLHSPSNILLANLALSDLGVGFVVQPSFIVSKYFQLSRSLHAVCTVGSIAESLFFVIAGVSFFTLTGIAVNQFLALHFHLRYNSLITTEHAKIGIVIVWVISIGLGLLRYMARDTKVFCYVAIVAVVISLLVASACYVRILSVISKHRNQIYLNFKITSKLHEGISFPKYKRSINTMLYIWALYLLCYVPLLCVLLYRGIHDKDSIQNIPLVGSIVVTITMAGSCFNPIVYCLRITEIRAAAIKTAREMIRLNLQLNPAKATRIDNRLQVPNQVPNS